MKREIRLSEKIWLAGLIFIFVFMLIHDWVSLGPLNDVEAIKQENTFQELLFVTLFNASQILLLIVLVLLWVKDIRFGRKFGLSFTNHAFLQERCGPGGFRTFSELVRKNERNGISSCLEIPTRFFRKCMGLRRIRFT